MYLVCPSCDATYEISERHFTDGMRQVRCTSCEYQWVAGADTAGTINDLMGESADEAFTGLRGFLERGKAESSQRASERQSERRGERRGERQDGKRGNKKSIGTQLLGKENDIARREAVLKMLGGDTTQSQSSGVWFWITFLFLLLPIAAIAVLFFGQNEIIKLFPEAAAIYEFVQSVGSMVYTTAEDLLQF